MERAIRLSAEMVDRRLEQAAATLGAGRWRIFTSITLPLMLPGIVTGVLLSFGRSLGEFGATITFVSNIPGETRTLPLAIYTFTQIPDGDAAALRLVIDFGGAVAGDAGRRRISQSARDGAPPRALSLI